MRLWQNSSKDSPGTLLCVEEILKHNHLHVICLCNSSVNYCALLHVTLGSASTNVILHKVVEVSEIFEIGCLLVDKVSLLLHGRFLANWHEGVLSLNHGWVNDGSVKLCHHELLLDLADELFERDADGLKVEVVV